MPYRKLLRFLTKSLSTTLCAALLVASVGPQTTSAVAQVIGRGVTVQSGVRANGITSVPSLASPLNSSLRGLTGAFSPSLKNILPTAPGVSIVKTGPGAASVSIPPAPAAIATHIESGPLNLLPTGEKASPASVPKSTRLSPRQTLETGVRKIIKSRGLSGKFSSIKALFTGSRQGTNLPAVTAIELGPNISLSGLTSDKSGGRSSVGSGSLKTLEAVAVDSAKDLAERQEAVRAVIAIAQARGDRVKPVLERIAEANPEGAAADYEVHRTALKGLAEVFNDLRSLRPITDAHAAGILADLRDNKPAMVISDYDDTLRGFREPLDEQDGARLQAVAEAGVQPVILTDRPAVPKREGDVGVLESVSALTPAQKSGLTVISDKSLNSTTFDPETGEPNTTPAEAVVWTTEERAALAAAKDVVLERVETVDFNEKGRFSLYDSGLAIFLKLRMPAEKVEAAANLLKDELAKRGVTGYNVVGRTPAKDPHKNPPYLSVTKVDKSVGVRRILAERGISGKDVVIMGDQFMTQGAGRATDEFMLHGAPDARAFAVGPTADPRLDGVFLWNKKGPEASREILEALAAEKSGRSSIESNLSLKALQAIAVDSTIDLAERQEAVKAIIELSQARGDRVKSVLERIAEANPEGAAADYEVHRAALRGLAEVFDDLRSLRPISARHKKDILSSLVNDKPELYLTDYDDTLQKFRTEISPEVAQGLKEAADAGVEVAILTDRTREPRHAKDVSVVQSLNTMTPEQKASIHLLSDRGTEITQFDKNGDPVHLYKKTIEWTAEEKAAIEAVVEVAAAKYGRGEFDGKTEFWSPFTYSMLLPVGMQPGAIKEAAAFFQAELKNRGVDIPVLGRSAKDPAQPGYLAVSRVDKSIGVKTIRANIRRFEISRDILRWGLPNKLAIWAFSTLSRFLPKRPISAKKTLLVGDQFYDTHVSDIGMLQGAPGGMAISVGGKADPRLNDVVLWDKEGEAASLEILGALGKQAPSEMNKKAVFGLFAQRTASIAAFILTTIAFPFLAVPVVGWTGYGILMSFGPLAGIATGPLNGLIADRLSARNGMALNTVIRVITSLALPVLAAFGYLNFSTLLIASIANGWLLSSIMTTENSYIKRLAGAKNVFTISNLAWMNYLVIQVVLGLLLGIGSIVDAWDPMIAFTINAAVNAVIVLPIIWFTMPRLSPQPKTLVKMEARVQAIRKDLLKAKGGKKEKLAAEEAELLAAIPARESMLKGDISKNREAMNESSKELAALRDSKPKGIRGRIARFSQTKALQADISLRGTAIRTAQADLDRVIVTAKDRLAGIAKFLKNNRLSEALLAGGIGLYFVTNTTLPIIGALLYWITTTNGFKVLWYGKGSDISEREAALTEKIDRAKKAGTEVKKSWKKELSSWKNRLPRALLLLSLLALMMYPFQYLALPKIALLLAGTSGKALLMGQLLGALFFGNLIPNAAQAKLPEIKIPFIGRVPLQRLIQGLVVGLGMAWVYTGLFPGSVLATLAAAPVIAGLMALASKLTKRAWVKFAGIGFAAVWIPYLVWGTGLIPFISPVTAMMLAVLGIGMAFGPAYTTLMGYFFTNAAKDKSGAMGGVQGSFFNAAISGGYGLLALVTSVMNPAFPAVLGGMGVLFMLAGLMFLKGSNGLPGLPKTLLQPKEDN